MSLIFTNSSQDEYDDSGAPIAGFSTQIGLERPYHYKNNLKNTLTIPPNSKVAVQSVEFEREPLVSFDEEDRLEWWLGEILHTGSAATIKTMGQTVSVPMPIWMAGAEGDMEGDYTRKESAAFLQKQLRQYICMPSYFATAVVNQFSSDLQKYNFEIESLPNVDHSSTGGGNGMVLPGTTTTGTQSWFQPTEPNIASTVHSNAFTASSNGDNIHRKKATDAAYTGGADARMWDVSGCSPICRTYPISQTNGSAVFRFNDPAIATHEWDIGFTRAITYQGDHIVGEWMEATKRPGFPDGGATPYDADNFPVMDFMVSFRYNPSDLGNAAANKQFRCYQLKTDTQGNRRMEEVRYWQAATPYQGKGGSNAPATILDQTDAVSNAWEQIKFNFQGECLKVELGTTGGVYTVLCDAQDSTGRDKEGVWKSVDMNQWGLYPRLNIPLYNSNIHIYEYDSPIVALSRNRANEPNYDSFDYPLDPDDFQNVAPKGAGNGVYSPGNCWWSNRYLEETIVENDDGTWGGFPTNEEVWRRSVLIEEKTFNLPYGDGNCEDSPWAGLDGDNQNPNYIHGCLAQHNDVRLADANLTPAQALSAGVNAKYGLYPCETSTMGLPLGLEDINPLQSGTGKYGTTSKRDGSGADTTNFGKWVFQSNTDVTILAKTLLVSCPTLTHQSYNFCINAPSKFLYHCPRFTADGRSSGRMFFEPAEKTYVKLNNPTAVQIQDIEIRLTDKNGRPALDLQGSTSVVIHIDQ